MAKAIVLSSGGLDSTTCLSLAIKEMGEENVMTVSVSYGQKHSKELECANKVAHFYGVPHKVIDLSNTGIMDDSDCPLLTGSTKEIPHKSYDQQIKENGQGMVSTYVPFRNGLMLSSIAALAMAKYPDEDVHIYIGVHADDAAGNAYADCSPHFIDAMYDAIYFGTYGKVRITAPFVKKNKAQVVRTGLVLGTPYHLTWSCYEGGDKPCGKCGTCIDRAAAFAANGVEDPALKEE